MLFLIYIKATGLKPVVFYIKIKNHLKNANLI